VRHGGQNDTMKIARENGGKTLEMCMWDNKERFENIGVKFADPQFDKQGNLEKVSISYGAGGQDTWDFWDACSESLASQATGDVHCVMGASTFKGYHPIDNPTSVYNRIEKPQLDKKGITPIFVDPIGGMPYPNNIPPKTGDAPQPDNLTPQHPTPPPPSHAPPTFAAHQPTFTHGSSPQPNPQGGNPTMTEIDVSKIKVAPFEFISYKEFKITKLLNEHATLYIRGFVEDEKQIQPLLNAQGDTEVTFSNGDDIYFEGVLENAEIDCQKGEVYELIVKAIGNTILLDTEKHNRSFQDNGQTYKEIVTDIVSPAGSTATYNADTKTAENIILQYEETDWAFAKRLAC